jgi:hypothetical protein
MSSKLIAYDRVELTMLKKTSLFLSLSLLVGSATVSYADDFDGGIPIDDLIDDKLETTLNIEFIKRNAKSKALRGAAKGKKGVNQDCGGTGNQTFGPGANLQGATIVNLSDNKGATSVCTK